MPGIRGIQDSMPKGERFFDEQLSSFRSGTSPAGFRGAARGWILSDRGRGDAQGQGETWYSGSTTIATPCRGSRSATPNIGPRAPVCTRQYVENCVLCCEYAVRGCAGGPDKTRVPEGRHTAGWDPSPGTPRPLNTNKGEDRHGELGFAMRHRVSHAEELGVRAPPSQGLQRAA